MASHHHHFEWAVVKGVSDFAGDNKSESDSWRHFSSSMAASLVAKVLKEIAVSEEWRHSGNK